MQASQGSFAIKPSAFPTGEAEYTVAGWLDYDMDLLAEHFCIKPSLYTGLGQRGQAFPWRYRAIFLQLQNGSYATLIQHEYRKEQVEIGLRVHNGKIFDEVDLSSLQCILPKNAGGIRKIDNGFVWVAAPQGNWWQLTIRSSGPPGRHCGKIATFAAGGRLTQALARSMQEYLRPWKLISLGIGVALPIVGSFLFSTIDWDALTRGSGPLSSSVRKIGGVVKYGLVIAFACLAGCTTMQWGEFDGQRQRMADPDVYDVVVVAVDGRADFEGKTNYRLQPGFHLLQVASTKPGMHRELSTIPFPINVKPCTKYSFVAKHQMRVGIDNWELLPTGETLMPGCEGSAKK